ncbi:Protein CBG09231 [Caenorhabditis briggsae]|uniref:Protein CBG09231 n=1 Tax=Caenorhabditis briggsae TaxID=6238 RepID=A8X8A4_CAEBR|nr:Protein CBG09231 [Caenorhabditis briggsae]CAP28865.2 Protein CBG09231 [Caenorhabditis briggsae]
MSREESNSDDEHQLAVKADPKYIREQKLVSFNKETSLAIKESLSKVAKYIGGFKLWPLLNDDCKRMVIDNLDYKMRCRLAITSKKHYALISVHPIHIHSIAFTDVSIPLLSPSFQTFQKSVMVVIEFEKDANQKYEIMFSEAGNSNYHEDAVEMVERFMKISQYGISTLRVAMRKYPLEKSRIKFLPNVKQVFMSLNDDNLIKWWLSKVPKDLDEFQLIPRDYSPILSSISTEMLALPQIVCCKKLCIYECYKFLNGDLLKLQARRISLNIQHVSDTEINQFLIVRNKNNVSEKIKFFQNWQNGKYVDGFKEACFFSTKRRDLRILLSGIENIIMWDDDFKEENSEIYAILKRRCFVKTCIQIPSKLNSFNSITANFDNHMINIFATGKAMKRDGKQYTRYRMP